ncbi:D-alanyl-D-alanine carboxypeptidase / D-alanyl-D-alanine-endopeptidase (penicillin-binding protein 4) [Micromonospora siamensis]|uniref:D-alanyl-D-alanine carboxypeptidase / D-alanyl-D-alanine-endopeptidase (Penicillin-binding protein 4) n=1 Tax=Micromonospora siamensis TaxID=299152 RepID=A0A1C5GPS0_9ACTN|nr:D-alanyl-D-alanine carboxypeptidase / D-alanyl-D-alanine-endopeptidase (penicillin-binding protein 4) [Micromonospora siamensis]
MGREDSHYRPDGVDGRRFGGSGSGGVYGSARAVPPEGHPDPGPNHPYSAVPGPNHPYSAVPGPGVDQPYTDRAAAGGVYGTRAERSPRLDPPTRPTAGRPAASGTALGPRPGPPVPPPARRRRVLPFAVLATVLLLVLAGVGVFVARPGPVAGWLGEDEPKPTASALPPEPDPQAVLAALDPNAPEPTPDGVRAALAPLVGQPELGSRVNVSVADVATGTSLYAKGADAPTVPASVTKLVTAVTVLEARGPGYRIPTRAVAGAAPGEVVIVGGGDPTLAVDGKGFYPGAARLDDLARQVKVALGGAAPTKVTVDATLFPGPRVAAGWDDDIPVGGFGARISALMTDGARSEPEKARRTFEETNHAAERTAEPDLFAGRAFARLLGLPESAVRTGKAPAAPASPASPAAGAPAPGTELGKVQSLPVIRLVDIMISYSDNVIAEALARQVALARKQPASFVGAGKAMDVVAGELGLPADELDLADGSGLSRNNRISPSLLTDLLTIAGNGEHPELGAIFGGLPVAAWSGTLDERYQAAGTKAGAGVVRAKTGTLTGVHAIAGLVTTADGRLLTFAVLTDQAPADSMDGTRRALDRITSALAVCGCR